MPKDPKADPGLATADEQLEEAESEAIEMNEPRLVTEAEQRQEQARRTARRAAATAPRKMPADESVPGGRFLVDGVLVDAEGKPLEGAKG